MQIDNYINSVLEKLEGVYTDKIEFEIHLNEGGLVDNRGLNIVRLSINKPIDNIPHNEK